MMTIVLEDTVRALLMNAANLPETLVVNERRYVPHSIGSGGMKGVIWKVVDDLGRERAAKLTTVADYESRSFREELTRAARLEKYPEFATLIDGGMAELEIGQAGRQSFVCFVEEWIDGLTLADFLREHRDLVDAAFLRAYVGMMCNALAALRAEGLRHDDLHSRNVMLERPPKGALHGEWHVRIVDTGSLKKANDPRQKPKDDHRHFVDQVIEIHNTIRSRKLLALREKRFLQEAARLLASMLDEDHQIALRAPEQVKESFDLAFERSARLPTREAPTLQSPFEYLSAEHLADDRLLVEIFAKSCPWLERVAGPDPCLVTGPRGCGKSTIFRWLSIKTHLHKPSEEFPQWRIAGFYISCSSDLQNRLGWIRSEPLAERHASAIVHYFNLLLAREILGTLAGISERADRDAYWGFGETAERSVHAFIAEHIGKAKPRVQGVSRIRQALTLVESEMARCHLQMLRGLTVGDCTPATFIGDLTSLLAGIGFFADKRIAFLVDDYSTHRLPEPVQIVLNRIIWERRASHVFKLSSEKYGAILTDPLLATAEVTRELQEIDCGREYVALDDVNQRERGREFVTELLANRLRTAKYTGSPDELIGHSKWGDYASLGRALREKSPGRTGNQYHGLECISDLCSGDVATMLLLFRRVFEREGVKRERQRLIPSGIQHEAIESVSRELFEALRYHFPHGPKMHEIVREFGKLVRQILEKGRLIKKGTESVPPQCPRIEVDQDYGTSDESLSADDEILAKEIVRRAVFIEMEPGRSRHKFATTLRWHLRRVYLPAFGCALSKNDAIKWRPGEFKFFLENPVEACRVEWQRRPKDTVSAQAERAGQDRLELENEGERQ